LDVVSFMALRYRAIRDFLYFVFSLVVSLDASNSAKLPQSFTQALARLEYPVMRVLVYNFSSSIIIVSMRYSNQLLIIVYPIT
jgi:hypothetical protein